LTRIAADGDLSAKSVGSGRWSRRAIRLCGKLKMIFIEALPEEIIIQTEHYTAALRAKGHVVIETSKAQVTITTLQTLIIVYWHKAIIYIVVK
jgi:hypothetical protein